MDLLKKMENISLMGILIYIVFRYLHLKILNKNIYFKILSIVLVLLALLESVNNILAIKLNLKN